MRAVERADTKPERWEGEREERIWDMLDSERMVKGMVLGLWFCGYWVG